jgi:hypothetical protein
MSLPVVRRAARLLFAPLILAIGGAAGSVADDGPKKVDSSLTFIADAETIFVNVDNESLAPWVSPIFEVLDRRFRDEVRPRTIVFEARLHPDRAAEVFVSGRPALADGEIRALLAAADLAKSPRTRVVDGTFRIVAQVNGGTRDDSGPLIPPLPKPGEVKFARLKTLSPAAKIAAMREWARAEAIPLLAAFARHRDRAGDEAVRRFGETLRAVPRRGPIDVAALTDKSPDYWRAMMAAPPHDPLIPAAQAALLVANGEIRRAKRIADAMGPFDDRQWGSSFVLLDFRWRLALLDQELGDRIRKGVALSDQGRLDEALRVFDAVLREEPTSPRALYERFHTLEMKGLKKTPPTPAEGWPEARQAILRADPLFTTMAVASGPDEAYDLLLRKEAQELFEDRNAVGRDTVRYAQIALDLGQPAIAAMLDWNVLRNFEPAAYGDRKLIEDVLYCLEQLGVGELKADFPGDHAAEFKRIAAERERRKRESPAFRAVAEPRDPESRKPSPAR